MNYRPLVLMIVLMMISLISEAQQKIDLYGGVIPNNKEKFDIKEHVLPADDGVVRVADVSEPAMYAYFPEEKINTGKAVIICPGGGYKILAMNTEGHDVAERFASIGITAFVLKYRLPNDELMIEKEIGPLQDAQRAIQLVRENAEKWKVNPKQIGIVGFSAGGHLASTLGTHYQKALIKNSSNTSLRPDFMLLMYPVISMKENLTHKGSRTNLLGLQPSDDQLMLFSNEEQVTADTPPTFLVHAQDDLAVPIANSLLFQEALKRYDISTKLLQYPKGGHGFGLTNPTSDIQWFNEFMDWLTVNDAERIHKQAVVIDTHNDVIYESIMKGKDIGRRINSGHTDLPRLKDGGVDVQFFSVWCSEKYGKNTAFSYANQQIDSLMKLIERYPDQIRFAKDVADISSTMGEKKIAAMIGVEGGHMIEDRIDYLDSLYKRGARYLTLTWNNSTSWASSAADENNPRSGLKHKGLTEKGKEIVRRMNELGMMVDLAHVGYQTYFDAIKTSTKPVLVSHSNAYAIAKVSRNLRDDQIKAITANGGVICVNFYSGFLDEKYRAKIDALYKKYVDPKGNDKLSSDAKYTRIPSKGKQELRPPLETLIDHIDHMVQLAGIDHVGIGGDFDGMESTPIGLDDVSDYPNLTKALLKRGYNEPDIIKILGGNVLRVIQAQGN